MMKNYLPSTQSDVVGALAIIGGYIVLRNGLELAMSIRRRFKK